MLTYSGQTEYVTRLKDERGVVRRYLLSREKVVGFGCQWKGGDTKIGVIEIATPCTVFIFHVGAYAERMDRNSETEGEDDGDEQIKQCPVSSQSGISDELRYLLESTDYLKVGVNINADFLKLSADFDIQFESDSILDLGSLYNEMCGVDENWNLCSLSKEILHSELERNGDVLRSEWTEYPLNDEQMRYCSETAYFALKLLFEIKRIPSNSNLDGELQENDKLDVVDDLKFGDEDEFDTDFEDEIDFDPEYDRIVNSLQNKGAVINSNDSKTSEMTDDVESALLMDIRNRELVHYEKLDSILSKYWLWSWGDFILPNRRMNEKEQRFIVNGTGNVNQKKLSLKKKEVYRCFTEFEMDCETIIQFRGYILTRNQIEQYLGDVINLGFEYNWKQIHEQIFKVPLNDAHSVSVQMKVIELLQQQITDILGKYPNAKSKLIPLYEQKTWNLKEIRSIYNEIWMMIKLKPMFTEISNLFAVEQGGDGNECKSDCSLVRYSVIRMIVFHIKRVVWQRHVASE